MICKSLRKCQSFCHLANLYFKMYLMSFYIDDAKLWFFYLNIYAKTYPRKPGINSVRSKNTCYSAPFQAVYTSSLKLNPAIWQTGMGKTQKNLRHMPSFCTRKQENSDPEQLDRIARASANANFPFGNV